MKFLEDSFKEWPGAIIVETKAEGVAIVRGIKDLLDGKKLNKQSKAYKVLKEISEKVLY